MLIDGVAFGHRDVVGEPTAAVERHSHRLSRPSGRVVDETRTGLGIAAGIGIGVALGVGMENIGPGIAIGVGISVAPGAARNDGGKRE